MSSRGSRGVAVADAQGRIRERWRGWAPLLWRYQALDGLRRDAFWTSYTAWADVFRYVGQQLAAAIGDQWRRPHGDPMLFVRWDGRVDAVGGISNPNLTLQEAWDAASWWNLLYYVREATKRIPGITSEFRSQDGLGARAFLGNDFVRIAGDAARTIDDLARDAWRHADNIAKVGSAALIAGVALAGIVLFLRRT
jgi:hypothetical protein